MAVEVHFQPLSMLRMTLEGRLLHFVRAARDDARWEELCGVLAGSPVKLLAGDGSVVFQDWLRPSERGDHVEFQAFVPRSRDNDPVPAKLVWDIPTKYRDLEVPFKFTGVPVP